MNAPFLHRSLTEYKNTSLNGPLTPDIIYGDSGSFNSRSNIWTYQYEQVFPMLYGEGYAIHEHLAPFELVYLKERTGFFAEGPDIGTSGFYNNLSIDDDLGNVNSSIETGCNTHRQTDWVKDKPGQEAYFDKNVTSKDDPDLKGRIYVGKTFRELRENNFLYYGDEKGDLYQDPRPIFSFKKDTREAQGQGGGRGWLDKTQIGMESYGLTNSAKEQLIKYAAKTDPSINNLKYVKGVKAAGKVLVVAGAAATLYEAYDDAFNKGSYYSAGTRLAVAGVASGAAFIPFVGWGLAGGIGIADAIWGDQFYNWVELNLRKEP